MNIIYLERRCRRAQADSALGALAALPCQLELLRRRHDPLLGAGADEQGLWLICSEVKGLSVGRNGKAQSRDLQQARWS
jgi:hypothetical protein